MRVAARDEVIAPFYACGHAASLRLFDASIMNEQSPHDPARFSPDIRAGRPPSGRQRTVGLVAMELPMVGFDLQRLSCERGAEMTTVRLYSLVVLTSFLAALTGCDGSEPAPDAGSGDAGSRDGGSQDGGPADSGPTDAGTPDAGAADSGAVDAGSGDSGVIDGGMGDAGATAGSFAGSFTDGASASTGVNATLDLTELTAEAWIRLDEMPTTFGNMAAVRKGGVDNHVGYELGVTVRSLGPLGEAQLHAYVALGNGDGCDSLTALTLGEAHHIAFQRDAAGLVSLVVDGNVVACTSEAFTSASGFGIDVGDAESSRPFAGIVDEVRLSDVARYTTATYTPERHFTPDANTVGLWHFDEGSGTTAHDASSTGADLTISGAGFSWVPEI